jgi:thiamine pyrophosphate-dependent acetolactate synthase large subunit-like protein
MKRIEALRLVLDRLSDEIVIHANGHISRESFTLADRPQNFYMLGSMGLASSIGLGIALARPERKVVVFDGDGNLLMNMGSLATIGAAAPANFYHLVFDNRVYLSTGGQRTDSPTIDIPLVAKAAGYRRVASARDAESLEKGLDLLFGEKGPALLHVEVEAVKEKDLPRVSIAPEAMRDRLAAELCGPARG